MQSVDWCTEGGMPTKKPDESQLRRKMRAEQIRPNDTPAPSDDFDIVVKGPNPAIGPQRNEKSGDRSLKYFTEQNLSRILSNLDEMRSAVFPKEHEHGDLGPKNPDFPSVCLIGVGRCGSNIALGVAALTRHTSTAPAMSIIKEGK